MKPPDVVKAEFTRDWVMKAEGDYRTAHHLFRSGADLEEGAAFHSQQAAEKYLKAFWSGTRLNLRKPTIFKYS